MRRSASRLFIAMMTALCVSLPATGYSASALNVIERPSFMAMTGDLVVARPILLATTAIGTAVFVVSLPFSLLGGNAGEAAQELVVGPAKATFVRCLGCTNSGYKGEVVKAED